MAPTSIAESPRDTVLDICLDFEVGRAVVEVSMVAFDQSDDSVVWHEQRGYGIYLAEIEMLPIRRVARVEGSILKISEAPVSARTNDFDEPRATSRANLSGHLESVAFDWVINVYALTK